MCVFCDIVAGKVPAEVVVDRPSVMAFRDADPKAPVHVLVIPKTHVRNVIELSERAPELWAELMDATAEVARKLDLDGRGFRVVTNTGVDGGQSVEHLHLHVLGGRRMHWPPG